MLDLEQFGQLVRAARSQRRYVNADPIPHDIVLKLVDLGRVVPSAINQQVLRYHIVTDPQECEQVRLCTNWGRATEGPFFIPPAARATGYIIILSTPSPRVSPAVDVGIAAQTMQLAASAAGYAACMIGDVDRERLRQVQKLPADMKVELLLGLGRPGEKVVLDEVPADGKSMFWRTADGAWHVAKRKLADVLV